MSRKSLYRWKRKRKRHKTTLILRCYQRYLRRVIISLLLQCKTQFTHPFRECTRGAHPKLMRKWGVQNLVLTDSSWGHIWALHQSYNAYIYIYVFVAACVDLSLTLLKCNWKLKGDPGERIGLHDFGKKQSANVYS